MSFYIKEFAPVIRGEGIKEISVLIDPSFRQAVYFEIYNNNDIWTVFWNYEIPREALLGFRSRFLDQVPSVNEIAADEAMLKEVRSLSEVFSSRLDNIDILPVKDVINKGLPDPEFIPRGLDGHSYFITLNGSDKEYECWCTIPKEWSHLIPLIEMLVKKASLPDSYLAIPSKT